MRREVDHRIHGPLHGLFIRNHLDVLDGDRSSAFHLGELGGPLEQFQDETRITTRGDRLGDESNQLIIPRSARECEFRTLTCDLCKGLLAIGLDPQMVVKGRTGRAPLVRGDQGSVPG